LTTIKLPIADLLNSFAQIDTIPSQIAHNFTIVESFNNSNGKFPEALGNVMIIDCHSAPKLLETTYLRFFDSIVRETPTLFVALNNFDQQIRDQLKKLDFC